MEEKEEKERYEEACKKWESECPCCNLSFCISSKHCGNGGPCKDYDSWLQNKPLGLTEIGTISRRNFLRLDLDRLSKELSLGKIITILKLIDCDLVRGESWFMKG